MLKPSLESKTNVQYVTSNARTSTYYLLPKSSIHLICLFFWALVLNYRLLTLELFRAHRIATRNIKIILGIFISKWIWTVTDFSISLHKYAAIESNENVHTKVSSLIFTII